jgi:hypothetical protein
MLVLHQLLYVLFTLRDIFMHFLELTYQQDATVPVPIFCCFCILEKLHRKYSRNWTKRKPNLLFFPTRRLSPKQRWRRARGWPHHRVAWVTPWPRHQVVWAPWVPSDIALPPINSLRHKTLEELASIHEKFRSAAAIKDKV